MNLYWVFLVVLLAACSPNSGNTKEQMVLSPEYTLEIYDEALAKKLQETLNAEGIYYKVIEDNSVWGFIAKKDGVLKGIPYFVGDVFKAAGWAAPAKHVRGSIFATETNWYAWTGPNYL